MLDSKLVLIADDDEDLLQAVAQRCRMAGLEVETAHNGMTALLQIDSLVPDLIILDVNMPSGSGLSVCEMIARDPCLKSIPVIVMTGRQDTETIRTCHNLLAYYVPKGPLLWSRLETLLAELIGAKPPAIASSTLGPAVVPPLSSISANALPARAQKQPPESKATHVASCHPATAQRSWIDGFFDALGRYEAKPGPGSDATRAMPQPSESPCVLCIDDDADFSHSLQLRLRQYGVDVQRACNGMEGYRDAFIKHVQAIVLDYSMPDGNGDYVLRRLKENPITCDIPVLVITGRKDKGLEQAMHDLGAARFLTKPVEWRQLFSELGRYVNFTPGPLPA